MKGRKRHVLVDTLGLVLAVVVTSAAVSDPAGARCVLNWATFHYYRLRKVWADSAYGGSLVPWVKANCLWVLEIVRGLTGQKGFQVQPHRWVVERTFGWLGRYRRLSKDYEYLTTTSETMIYLAMIHVMMRRLH